MNPMMNQMANMTPAQLEMIKKYTMMNTGIGMNPNTRGTPTVNELFSGSSVAGPGGGTSLSDLNKVPSKNSVQHNRRQNSPESNPHSESNSVDREEQNKIHHLVRNINQSLDDYAPSKSQNTEDSEDDSTEKEENINQKSRTDSYIPDILKEPLLLIIIYVVLSQGFVRKGIGSYISYINPGQDGYVSFIGYVIYGTILAILFMFFKKILIK